MTIKPATYQKPLAGKEPVGAGRSAAAPSAKTTSGMGTQKP